MQLWLAGSLVTYTYYSYGSANPQNNSDPCLLSAFCNDTMTYVIGTPVTQSGTCKYVYLVNIHLCIEVPSYDLLMMYTLGLRRHEIVHRHGNPVVKILLVLIK